MKGSRKLSKIVWNILIDLIATFWRLFPINNQIKIWEVSPDSTEKWLLSVETSTAELLKEFKARVVVAREKISKIL